MARVRAAMPAIEAGLRAGHSLRTVHKLLNQEGLEITYRCLVSYRARIRRGKKSQNTLVAKPDTPSRDPSPETAPEAPGESPSGFDPAANFHKQIKNRTAWEYPSGPPDEKKLF
jgi:hypothetical protein